VSLSVKVALRHRTVLEPFKAERTMRSVWVFTSDGKDQLINGFIDRDYAELQVAELEGRYQCVFLPI
jgi:hypothetical protein